MTPLFIMRMCAAVSLACVIVFVAAGVMGRGPEKNFDGCVNFIMVKGSYMFCGLLLCFLVLKQCMTVQLMRKFGTSFL